MAQIYHFHSLYAFGDKKELEHYRKFLLESQKKELKNWTSCDSCGYIQFEEEGTLKSPFRVFFNELFCRTHVSACLEDIIITKFPKLVFFGTGTYDARESTPLVGLEWFAAKDGKILGIGEYLTNPEDFREDDDDDDPEAYFDRTIKHIQSEEMNFISWMENEGIVEKLGETWKDKTFCAGLVNVIKEAQGYEDYDYLQYMPENLKTAEFYIEGIKEHGLLIQYAPEKLKNAEFYIEAVKQNGMVLEFVPEKLKTAELYLEAVKNSGSALQYVPEKLKTAELCLEAIKKSGDALEHVPEKLKTEEICTEAIKNQSWQRDSLLEHVPKTLKPKMKKLIKKLEAEEE